MRIIIKIIETHLSGKLSLLHKIVYILLYILYNCINTLHLNILHVSFAPSNFSQNTQKKSAV